MTRSKSGNGRHRRKNHRTDPGSKALSKFTVFHDPTDNKVSLPSPSNKSTGKPAQAQPQQQTDPTTSQQQDARIRSRTMATETRKAENLRAPVRVPKESSSDYEEAQRFERAKPVNALVLRSIPSPTTLATVGPGGSLVRWRRQRGLRRWLKSLPLKDWARLAYITSVHGVLLGGLVYFGIPLWEKYVSSDQPSVLTQHKETVLGKNQRPRSAKGRQTRRQPDSSQTRDNRAGRAIPPNDNSNTLDEAEESQTRIEPSPLAESRVPEASTKERAAYANKPTQQTALPKKSQIEARTSQVSSPPEGTNISMQVVTNVRSAHATAVKARVTTDVRDGTGRITIPAGTVAHVPLSAPDKTGRFGSEPDSSVWFVLDDGRTVGLKISVRGADGGSGLPGTISKAGRWGKLFRGLADAGTAIGKEFDRTQEAARALEEALPERGGEVNRGHTIAEIKAGVRFWLLVR